MQTRALNRAGQCGRLAAPVGNHFLAVTAEMMELTLDQVVAMAPDDSSATAGKKLMAVKNWSDLGRSPSAVWGKCQGSRVYQVKVDLASLGYACTCPSRKFPCKHALGLMMLGATSPESLADSSVAPEWVTEWLQKRRDRQQKQAGQEAAKAAEPVDPRAQQRRAERREANVHAGLERLDLWMRDLVRTGLGGLESKPPSFWDEQAKRLVDAQAPGLAARIERLASLLAAGRDWPERLLGELGRLELLIHAYGRQSQLEAPLRAELRQMIGWNVSQAELEAEGERVEDRWVVAGQWTDDEPRVRIQRSWIVGRQTGRAALVLQFAAGNQPFAEAIVPGTEQSGALLFYPGASGQRARLADRTGAAAPVQERIPGWETAAQLLDAAAEALARQPWLNALGGVLRDAVLLQRGGEWLVRDRQGEALPLAGSNHWRTLAITGGQPVDLAGEWDGGSLRPLGMLVAGSYWSV